MDDPDHYRKLEDFPVQKKVHSLAVDLETHRVYAPEQEADGKSSRPNGYLRSHREPMSWPIR